MTHATDMVRQIAHRAAVFDHGADRRGRRAGRGHPHLPRDAATATTRSPARPKAAHATAIDPVTGELPVIIAPAELVPDAGAEVTIASVDIEYPDAESDALLPGQAAHASGSATTPPG